MFDQDELVAECMRAVGESGARLAVRDVLQRALSAGAMPDAATGLGAGLHVLYSAPNLTVLNVVWPPLMTLFPHDHRMWATIAIYGGREDNFFYRRQDERLVASGGKQVTEGHVLMLGDDTIHAVHNPAHAYTGAIHVYGGDLLGIARSQWDPETLAEEPYDQAGVLREFERADQLAIRDT
jgi:predicted metal-dependent enzyme (double-stranded beta helix superfamily)